MSLTSPFGRSEIVKRSAAEIGFDRCGITTPGPMGHASFFRSWLAKGYAGSMGYLHRHPGSRLDVRDWLPWARSIIVVAVNYKQPAPGARDDRPRGRVAMYAWGSDYHIVVRERLETLARTIDERIGRSLRYRICVDTSAIIERELAARAGIGWIGKNTLVMHQSLGSFFFLGELITDLELAPDEPEPDHCGSCTRCLEACPTAAFPEPYVMDARRCISYLTIEHRDAIEPDLAERIGDWVFGCDDCQTICPFNDNDAETGEAGFRAGAADAFPSLDEILEWDVSDYRTAIEGKATARAKLHMWKRNAEIARRNLER